MDITAILESITPLGLVALIIILGYYAINRLSSVLETHYERQTDLLRDLLEEMEKCAKELEDIQDSFQKRDNN